MRGIDRKMCALVLVAASCGSSSSGSATGGDCDNRCTSFGWERCVSPGEFAEPESCSEDQVCIADLGCSECIPGALFCEPGEEVWRCSEDGSRGEYVKTCQDSICSAGECKSACEASEDHPSNVGCHFWSTDLDNEAFEIDLVGGAGISNDAAAQQFAVAIANNNEYPVDVRVYRNSGRVGQPVAEEVVASATVAPRSLEQINLPQREIDGTMGQNGSYSRGSGSGSFVSPHAYRIETTGPVVAYQFNPIVQQFSNDASILIPRQALGNHYYVLGWPTSNPCGGAPGTLFHQDSIPDHGSVTIVGTQDDTTVRVRATHPIVAAAGDTGLPIPTTPAGEILELSINRYDVVNLESDQPLVDSPIDCIQHTDRDGDFTGSLVESTRPVAVFSSNERATGYDSKAPKPPAWDDDTCCTDHLEQQMFPTSSLGWEFAVSRSPVRSTGGYKEPDLYRVLATEDDTVVTTNLLPPHDRFELNAGEWASFHAQAGFTLRSEGGAVMLGQYLVSQRFTQDGIGDPTFVVFPAAEQHRKAYVFLVPTTFSNNYMVLAIPQGASLDLDGKPLGEFAGCSRADIGSVKGTPYEQVTCALGEGVHVVDSNQPFGLTVYGYYSAGSYGYPGGSDVARINPID